MIAQITEVNKALLSVHGLVKAGNRVVFGSDGSYVEDKTTGEWIDIAQNERGLYTLRMWVPKNQEHLF